MPLIDLNGLGHFKDRENAMVAPDYSASATYAVGDYVFYNGVLYKCKTAITTAEAFTSGHWEADVLANDVAELNNSFTESKSTIDLQNVSNSEWRETGSFRPFGISATASNWRLLPESGLCVSDNDYVLYKYYNISANKLYYVHSDYLFQFQNSQSVPSSGTSNRVGKTYGEFDGYIVPPEGGTTLILCTKKGTGTAKLYNPTIKEIVPYWNINKYGMKIDGNSIVINQDGFGMFYNGYIYFIAPTDHETITTLTAESSNNVQLLLLDTTQLGTAGQRTNPSDVLSVVKPSPQDVFNYPVTSIPIAVYKFGWKFFPPFNYFDEGNERIYSPVSSIFAENQLIAHKGGSSGTANTIANFTQAIADGYKVLEMDVRITADKVAVLSHDATFTVDSTTYTIAEEDYDTLIGANPNLATLWDALLLCKQNNVIADIDFTKVTSADAINATYDCITKLGMQGRCFISCPSSVGRTFLAKSKNLCICVSSVTTTAQIDSFADIAKTAMVSMCSTDAQYVTQELVNYIHSNGFLSKPWVANTTSDIETLFGYGCDMVITDSVKPSDLT